VTLLYFIQNTFGNYIYISWKNTDTDLENATVWYFTATDDYSILSLIIRLVSMLSWKNTCRKNVIQNVFAFIHAIT